MRLPEIETQTFLAVVLLLIICVLSPGLQQLKENEGPILFSSGYREQALIFQLKLFGVFLSLGASLLWVLRTSRSNAGRFIGFPGFRQGQGRVRAFLFVSLLSVNATMLWFFAHDIEAILAPASRFSSTNPITANVTQWLFLASFMLSVFLLKPGLARFVFMCFTLSMFLIYPISISSRSVGIPFLLLATYYVNKNINAAFFWAAICALMVAASLLGRAEWGFSSFFGGMYAALDPQLVYESISSTFPGSGSTGLALEMFDRKEVFGMENFALYASPLPSVVLESQTLGFSSIGEYMRDLNFTDYTGASNIHLNADIYSEWIFWGGAVGWLYGAIFFVALVITPSILRRSGFAMGTLSRLMFQATILFFFIAGMSMQVRAASRPFFYVLCITLLLRLFKKLLKRSRLANTS